MLSNFRKHILWRVWGKCRNLSDENYLRMVYYLSTGKILHLKNPKTFNEKVQWLKLYAYKPEYAMMVDKYRVKEYVAGIIGEEHIIPTYGMWERAEDIDFDSLPDQFVLKCNHDCGGLVICKDKSKLNYEDARAKMKQCLERDYFWPGRDKPYRDVKRCIFAEKYMTSQVPVASNDLWDYKFFCFDGEPKYCQVIRDRSSKETIDFYDMAWNHQEFVGLNPKCQNGITPVSKPDHLDDMIRVCRKLSKGIPFVRVDLYSIDDKEYFGELTFYPQGGMGHFSPEEWNIKIGEILNLPTTSGGGGYKCLINSRIIEIIKIDDKYEDIKDYKFFCFNGKVKCFKIDFDRFCGHKANYYNPAGELLHYGEQVCPPDFNHIETMPSNLNQMIEIAEKLSAGHPFLRVDLYNIEGIIYFGEMTFYPAGGFGVFIPESVDYEWGKWITLPSK